MIESLILTCEMMSGSMSGVSSVSNFCCLHTTDVITCFAEKFFQGAIGYEVMSSVRDEDVDCYNNKIILEFSNVTFSLWNGMDVETLQTALKELANIGQGMLYKQHTSFRCCILMAHTICQWCATAASEILLLNANKMFESILFLLAQHCSTLLPPNF